MEPRPLLARGDGDLLSFAAGLMDVSRRWTCFRGGVVEIRLRGGVVEIRLRGGVVEILFTGFLGEREPDELLPEDEAERERLLEFNDHN